MFEDVRYEVLLILLLSITDQDILKQSNFTDQKIYSKKSCSGKIPKT